MSAKQEFLDEQEKEIIALRAQLSSLQVHDVSHKLCTD